jgi:hypothetical protein
MIEYAIIFIAVASSGALLARRFYRQLRALLDSNAPFSCSQGCCGCSTSSPCHQVGGKRHMCSTGERR